MAELRCACGQGLQWTAVEEYDEETCFGYCNCSHCGVRFGLEAEGGELSSLLTGQILTDEAQHVLDRLPPYIAPLVREEIERYAESQKRYLVTLSLVTEARTHGSVTWNPEAEQRLKRVPAPVRAMARAELERTALDRGMKEITISLMEEVKARYFGMGSA